MAKRVRPLEIRIAEKQEQMDRLELQKKIIELRAKLPKRRRKR